jgi:hypothetical protein
MLTPRDRAIDKQEEEFAIIRKRFEKLVESGDLTLEEMEKQLITLYEEGYQKLNKHFQKLNKHFQKRS